jgi:hypothetical protein
MLADQVSVPRTPERLGDRCQVRVEAARPGASTPESIKSVEVGRIFGFDRESVIGDELVRDHALIITKPDRSGEWIKRHCSAAFYVHHSPIVGKPSSEHRSA